MKTVFINLKEGEINYSQEVTINSIITLDSSFVEVVNYLKENELGVLIQFKHNQTTIKLHLTDVSPYVLLFFDDELNFKGASYSIRGSAGCFTIQTQFKHILFLRVPHSLQLSTIVNLKF